MDPARGASAVAAGGLGDEVLLRRLAALYSEAFVADVAADLKEARNAGHAARVAEIHASFTCRMHDLSQFMKGLLIRFTRWFNRTHSRAGIVADPAENRWSSYGEAVGGGAKGSLWSVRDLRLGV